MDESAEFFDPFTYMAAIGAIFLGFEGIISFGEVLIIVVILVVNVVRLHALSEKLRDLNEEVSELRADVGDLQTSFEDFYQIEFPDAVDGLNARIARPRRQQRFGMVAKHDPEEIFLDREPVFSPEFLASLPDLDLEQVYRGHKSGKGGFVYILIKESNHLCKIGMTVQRMKNRLSGLKSQYGDDLRVVHLIPAHDTRHAEKRLHYQWQEFWFCNEWYALPEWALKNIMEIDTFEV